MSEQDNLMKSKRFLPLFVTQFLGAFNDNAFKNAFLIWFTYDIAAAQGLNPAMMVTIAAGLFIFPFFLFSATAGQVADKYEQSWLTQKIKQVEILLMILCIVCFVMQSVNGLLVILFMMGVQSTFFGPIKYSLLPEHLHEHELIKGNGLIEGGTFLSILLGTIFGGLIIRTEYGVEMLAACVIGFAAIGWLSSRHIPQTPIGEPDLEIGWNIARETWKIIGFARQERTVWLSIIGISWFWLIGATFLTQFPTYTKEVLGGNEHIVTLLLTIFSIGIGVGSVWCNSLLKGEINGKLVPLGCIGMTACIIAFYAMSQWYVTQYGVYVSVRSFVQGHMFNIPQFFEVGLSSWGIIVSLLALSVCAGVYIVPLYAIMQHRSEQRYLSRIIASNNVMNALFMVVASLVAIGLFGAGLNVTDILLVVGIANIPVYVIVRGVVKRRLDNA